MLSQRLFFPPLLLSAPLLLSPFHKVLDIFSQSDGLYDGPHPSGHFGLDQLVEGQLRVPVAPNGSAVCLLKLLPTRVRPGEAGNLRIIKSRDITVSGMTCVPFIVCFYDYVSFKFTSMPLTMILKVCQGS